MYTPCQCILVRHLHLHFNLKILNKERFSLNWEMGTGYLWLQFEDWKNNFEILQDPDFTELVIVRMVLLHFCIKYKYFLCDKWSELYEGKIFNVENDFLKSKVWICTIRVYLNSDYLTFWSMWKYKFLISCCSFLFR